MTVSSMSQAADEMLALFRAAWELDGRTAAYPLLAFTKPAKGATWARWTIQHATGAQATLAGAAGGSRFMRGGIIIVQVFTPLASGLQAALDAAEIVVNAYQGKRTPSDVWFRNVRPDEIENTAQKEPWHQTNVIAEFTYEQYQSN